MVVPADDFEFDLDRDLTDFGVTDLDRPDPEAGEPERDGDSELERAEPDLERAGKRVGDKLDCRLGGGASNVVEVTEVVDVEVVLAFGPVRKVEVTILSEMG